MFYIFEILPCKKNLHVITLGNVQILHYSFKKQYDSRASLWVCEKETDGFGKLVRNRSKGESTSVQDRWLGLDRARKTVNTVSTQLGGLGLFFSF